MAMDIEIRPMNPTNTTDLDAASALETACFSEPWSRNSLMAEMNLPNALFLGAFREKSLLGYTILHHVLDEGEVVNMAVDPAARRQGVGAALMADLIARATATGVKRLFLEVRKSNAGAIRLYEYFGFRLFGRRQGYYKQPTEDAFLMRVFL